MDYKSGIKQRDYALVSIFFFFVNLSQIVVIWKEKSQWRKYHPTDWIIDKTVAYFVLMIDAEGHNPLQVAPLRGRWSQEVYESKLSKPGVLRQ